MPLRLALGVTETVAGHRLGALEGGYLPPLQCIPASACLVLKTTFCPAMPEIELYYWPVTGLGEPIRLALAVGGIPFQDHTPASMGREAFMAKKEAVGSQVPFLVVDGKVLGQSRAILRYVGKALATYEGRPLYPTDAMEAYECDELIELIEDLRAPLAKTFAIADQQEKEAARAALFAADGAYTRLLPKVDQRLAAFGPAPHVGDLYAFSVLNMLRQPTFLDGVPPGAMDQYQNINAHHEFVAKLPPVLEYYKDAEAYRTTFKPFS